MRSGRDIYDSICRSIYTQIFFLEALKDTDTGIKVNGECTNNTQMTRWLEAVSESSRRPLSLKISTNPSRKIQRIRSVDGKREDMY